jgi:mRNA interferase MazF
MGLLSKVIIHQRDLVLLSYPFSDLEERKFRPALVISNDLFNQISRDFILVPLTSVIKDEPYSIIIDNQDLSNGKLIKQSRIKVDKVFSIEKSLIKIKIGSLNKDVFSRVRQEFLKLI